MWGLLLVHFAKILLIAPWETLMLSSLDLDDGMRELYLCPRNFLAKCLGIGSLRRSRIWKRRRCLAQHRCKGEGCWFREFVEICSRGFGFLAEGSRSKSVSLCVSWRSGLGAFCSAF